MEEQPPNNATVYTLLFAGILVGGAVLGTSLAVHLVPESHAVAVIGLLMLPLGVVAGVSFGQGTLPPTSLFNLISVFNGRHTVTQMMSTNGSGGALSLAIGTLVGTVVVSVAMALLVNVFMKPELPFTELATWFGGVGLAYGLVSGIALLFMTEQAA